VLAHRHPQWHADPGSREISDKSDVASGRCRVRRRRPHRHDLRGFIVNASSSSSSSSSSNSPGYAVTPTTLHDAGQQAGTIGQAIGQLAGQVAPDTSVPDQPAGLGVGGAMHAMGPVWSAQFSALGTEVGQVGANLTATAGNYQSQDDHVVGHLRAITD
jgi:hypothetical protein